MPTRRTLLIPALAGAAVLALAGCSGAGSGSTDGKLQVLASFYPLQYIAEQVGGDHVDVTNLTPPGAEPHDLELAPAKVQQLGSADLVVYESGLQAAVDQGIEQTNPEHVVDAAHEAALEKNPNGKDTPDGPASEHPHESGDGHNHLVGNDPHFWLDPTRIAPVGDAVAKQLSAVDPDNASYYQQNAKNLAQTMKKLDAEYSAGLKNCGGAMLVTSHEAFGYLAERYDLDQVGISGIDPDSDPSPARLHEVKDVAEKGNVKTLYVEKLLSPKVTQILADEMGVTTKVLDPLENLAKGETDYLSVMHSNLKVLQDGLTCS